MTAASAGGAPAPAGIRPLVRLAERLAAATGARRLLGGFLLGGFATLALPPAGFVPVLWIAFPGLLWLLGGAASHRAAFALGWSFGFGHFLFGLYWISFALLTDVGRYWWLMPFAAAGLPAVLAVYTGLSTLVLHVLRLRGLSRVLAFAVLWSAAEWLRGHLFTGFPWNLLGYSWIGAAPVLQSVSVIGIYGLGLLTAVLASLPTLLGDPAVPRRRSLAVLASGCALFAILAAAGAARLAQSPTGWVEGVRLRLVQANIDQRLKWAPEERAENFRRHLEMSAEPSALPPTHVIWPETAVPYLVDRDMSLRLAMAAVIPPGGLVITGAPRAEDGPDGRRFRNSMVAVDGSGAVRGTYDKAHLVPFGEYMPLRRWIPLPAVAAAGGDFSAGPGPRTMELPGLPPVSPLICYEVIFPGAVTSPGERPGWLLNLTNDAWYGETAGPHQHFAIARIRAVEEGLPLVRVANTGISGVVDPYGRVTARLGLGRSGVLDAGLPAAAAPTLYSRYGELPFVLILFIAATFATIARHRP